MNNKTKLVFALAFSIILPIILANTVPAQAFPFYGSQSVYLQIDDPTIEFTEPGQTVSEDATPVTVTANLTAESSVDVTVPILLDGSTATQGSDYSIDATELFIPMGETSDSLTITVSDDSDVEGSEDVIVTMDTPTAGAVLGDQSTYTLTITDNDELPTLNINSIDVSEGDSGTTNADFTVTLTTASVDTVTVNYATENGSATASSDYTATSDTLTFIPGDTTETITVLVAGDMIEETNENFLVTLSEPSNATLGTDQGVGNILNDDGPPVLSIDDVSVTEGNSGTVNAVFTVTLTPFSLGTVTVDYDTSNGSAIAPGDYNSASDTLTFTPGDTQESITVEVKGDTLNEDDENFFVTLSNPSGADLGKAVGEGTIQNDDPEPSLSINSPSVTEGDVNLTFTVTLSAASGKTVTVNYATSDGTATAPGDYTSISTGMLTFVPGDTTEMISVAVKEDNIDEEDETFSVSLSSPSNATLGSTNVGTGTIIDDDPPPVLSIVGDTVTEGDTAEFTVNLSAVSEKEVKVNYATSNGTATAPTDYIAKSGLLTFPPGEMTQTILVVVADDSIDEIPETFNVTLTSPINATLGTSVATGTINDNDPLAVLSINNTSVGEGNSGTVDAVFTVTLTPASGKTVTVNYATSNGSATAPNDYEATSGNLTFNPGETTKTIMVPVVGDQIDEADETFNVTLGSPSNATIGTVQGVGTILDNDTAGVTVTFATGGLQTSESGATDSFTIVLNSQPTANVTISLSSSDPGEGTVSPSFLTFLASNWFTPQTVTVSGVNDLIEDGPQNYNVLTGPITSADPKYGIINPADVPVTNVDNDTAGITLTPPSGLVTREGGGQATLKIILNTEPAHDVDIHISSSDTSEGVVSADVHTFTPDNWNETFTLFITGVDDTLVDGDINYQINLSATSTDGNYNGMNLSVSAVNRDAPNISWVEPISTGGIYEFDGLGPLLLEVVAASGEDIESVRFYRWDEPNLQHITIAEVSVNGSGEFQTFVDTEALNPGFNQVFAYAVNAEGMTSPHQWIWLLRLDGAVYKLYFPEVAKRP